MNVIRGETFRNQDVRIDFSEYEECTFENCNIIVEYGITGLRHCNFNNCRLTVSGPAQTIITIAQMFFPEIPVIKNGVLFKGKRKRK